jgi:hypothetical protein
MESIFAVGIVATRFDGKKHIGQEDGPLHRAPRLRPNEVNSAKRLKS